MGRNGVVVGDVTDSLVGLAVPSSGTSPSSLVGGSGEKGDGEARTESRRDLTFPDFPPSDPEGDFGESGEEKCKHHLIT